MDWNKEIDDYFYNQNLYNARVDHGLEQGLEQGFSQGIAYNVPIDVDTRRRRYPTKWTLQKGIKSLKVNT